MTQAYAEFDLLLAGAASGVIGVLSGMFGFGGGFLMVPVLNIALGVPVEFAAGASACQVLGPATTSLLARRVDWQQFRFPLIISGGLLLGVTAGANLLHTARELGPVAVGSRTVPLAELLVLTTYFIILIAVGGFTLYETGVAKSGQTLRRGWLTKWRLSPCARLDEFPDRPVSIPVLSWFGLIVGFLAGLLGNSGGLFLLPGLVFLLGVRTQQAVASSLVIVWLVSGLSTAVHAWLGHVHLGLVAALLFGGTIGARLGSEFGTKLSGVELRRRFGWVILTVAAAIALQLGRLLLR